MGQHLTCGLWLELEMLVFPCIHLKIYIFKRKNCHKGMAMQKKKKNRWRDLTEVEKTSSFYALQGFNTKANFAVDSHRPRRQSGSVYVKEQSRLFLEEEWELFSRRKYLQSMFNLWHRAVVQPWSVLDNAGHMTKYVFHEISKKPMTGNFAKLCKVCSFL